MTEGLGVAEAAGVVETDLEGVGVGEGVSSEYMPTAYMVPSEEEGTSSRPLSVSASAVVVPLTGSVHCEMQHKAAGKHRHNSNPIHGTQTVRVK